MFIDVFIRCVFILCVSACFFCVFLDEYLKSVARKRHVDQKETVVDLIGASITAKLVASSITYPHEVLRARLQDGSTKTSLFPLISQIVKEEGIRALWSGLRVNIIRIVPATCTTFVSYEYISRYITSWYRDSMMK